MQQMLQTSKFSPHSIILYLDTISIFKHNQYIQTQLYINTYISELFRHTYNPFNKSIPGYVFSKNITVIVISGPTALRLV